MLQKLETVLSVHQCLMNQGPLLVSKFVLIHKIKKEVM